MDGFDFGFGSAPSQPTGESSAFFGEFGSSNVNFTDPNSFISGGEVQPTTVFDFAGSGDHYPPHIPTTNELESFSDNSNPAELNSFLDFSDSGNNNAAYPPSNFEQGFVPANFSVDPSDFLPEEKSESRAIDMFSYPPQIETPLDQNLIVNSPNNFDEPKTPEEKPKTSIYSSLSNDSDSSKIIVKNQILRDYEFEHEKFLQERANEERRKHDEVLSQAQEELKRFYKEREDRSKKSKDENIERSSLLASNPPSDDKQAWLNLDTLLDWRNVNKDAKEDTSRMRAVLITMKH